MDAITLTLTSGSVLATLGFIAKWLLNSYFKNQQELEQQRFKNQTNQIDTLKESLAQSKSDMRSFESSMNEFKVRLAQHALKLEVVEKQNEQIQIEFKRVANQLEDRYKALEGAELINIKDNTFIFKTRK